MAWEISTNQLSALQIGGRPYELVAKEVIPSAASASVWEGISAEIGKTVAGVYTVKETLTAVEENNVYQITQKGAKEGDVHNISVPAAATVAYINYGTDHQDTIKNGDNIVWIGNSTTGYWDKLAASISLEGYAKEEWVNTNSSPATAIAAALTAASQMSAAGNAANLVQSQAITAYVDAKLTEAIAETIDIAGAPITAAAGSAIPNVSAVIDYTTATYAVKNHASITNDYGAGTTSLYGHVQVSTGKVYSDAGYADGIAASMQHAHPEYASTAAFVTDNENGITGLIASAKSGANASAWIVDHMDALTAGSYGRVAVYATSTATTPSVTTATGASTIMGFSAASDNISLITTANANGNPIVGISASPGAGVNAYKVISGNNGFVVANSYSDHLTISGINGITVSAIDNPTAGEQGLDKLLISAQDATTALAGITKASYVADNVGIIF